MKPDLLGWGIFLAAMFLVIVNLPPIAMKSIPKFFGWRRSKFKFLGGIRNNELPAPMPSDDRIDRRVRCVNFTNTEIHALIKRIKGATLNKDLRDDIELALAQLVTLRASVYMVHKGFVEPCELLGFSSARGRINNVVMEELCALKK